MLRDDQRVFLFVPTELALIQVEKLLGKAPSISPELIPHINSITEQDVNEKLLGHSSKESILEALIGIMAEAQQRPKDEKENKRKTIKL